MGSQVHEDREPAAVGEFPVTIARRGLLELQIGQRHGGLAFKARDFGPFSVGASGEKTHWTLRLKMNVSERQRSIWRNYYAKTGGSSTDERRRKNKWCQKRHPIQGIFRIHNRYFQNAAFRKSPERARKRPLRYWFDAFLRTRHLISERLFGRATTGRIATSTGFSSLNLRHQNADEPTHDA